MNATVELDPVLAAPTLHDARALGGFLAATRECGRDGLSYSPDRLRLLVRLEDRFQALLATDGLEFLREPLGSGEEQRGFALTVQRIWLEAANGFQRFLRYRNAWRDEREGLEAIARVTGLAMNAIHSYMKWGALLHEPGRIAPWKQMHALYALADAEGYSQMPFVLHDSDPAFRPSVQSLYLRALLLDLVNTGSVSKPQIEIADTWLSSWCADYSLDSRYAPRQHILYVDLASDSGLALVRRDREGEALRYLRADTLRAQIEEARTALRQGRVAASYGHARVAAFPVEEHVALLAVIEKLHRSLLAAGENRIEERQHFEDREVDVVLGIERLLRKSREAASLAGAQARRRPALSGMEMIEASPADLTRLASDPRIALASVAAAAADPEVERWHVYDLSSGGFGLLVDRSSSQPLLLSGIIGLRNQDTGGWIVGTIVRKQPNPERADMLVGVEVLAYRPIPVRLVARDADAGPPTAALYLPGAQANGKLDSLLLPIADFHAGERYALRAADGEYRIRLNRIMRKGADWIRAGFEIESKA